MYFFVPRTCALWHGAKGLSLLATVIEYQGQS